MLVLEIESGDTVTFETVDVAYEWLSKGSTFMPAYPFGGNMDLREMSPGATLEIHLEKGKQLNFPRLYDDHQTYRLGMADTLEKAHQIALDETFDLLVNDWKLDPFDAYAYTSACVAMRFGGPATAIAIVIVPDRDVEQRALIPSLNE